MRYCAIFLAICRVVLCGEECTSSVGGITLTITCTGNKRCCEDKTSCCANSSLSTGAIIAFAVGGSVFFILIISLVIYAIVKNKKTNSNVTPIQPSGSSFPEEPPPYTPRVLMNHPLPGAPPSYDAHASGSSFPPVNAPTHQMERKRPL